VKGQYQQRDHRPHECDTFQEVCVMEMKQQPLVGGVNDGKRVELKRNGGNRKENYRSGKRIGGQSWRMRYRITEQCTLGAEGKDGCQAKRTIIPVAWTRGAVQEIVEEGEQRNKLKSRKGQNRNYAGR